MFYDMKKIRKILDDVEARATARGKIGFQAVNPITREPVGPLRKNTREAEADDEDAFIRTRVKINRGEREKG